MSALASSRGRARTMLRDHCLHIETLYLIPKEYLKPYLYLLDLLSDPLEPKDALSAAH